MNMKAIALRSICGLALGMAVVAPLQAHHSFASYDMNKTRIVSGVVTRVNPDANHLQIFFAVMNAERKNVERDKDGKPVIWSIDMAGSAATAQEGISVSSFPPGTVFSAALHPQRSGDPSGFREGPLFKCPIGDNSKSVPPKPGQHCDTMEGHITFPTTQSQAKLAAPVN